jgi:hypothetical protein
MLVKGIEGLGDLGIGNWVIDNIMTNKIAIVVVGALLAISLLDQVVELGHPLVAYSASAATCAALMMMLANGTFTDRKYYTLAYFLMGATLLGFLLKILHWTGADQILVLSVIALVILYSIHFATKPSKGVLDILKFVTVLTNAAHIVLKITRIVGDVWTFGVVASAIFWITFLWFIVEGARSGQLFTEKDA